MNTRLDLNLEVTYSLSTLAIADISFYNTPAINPSMEITVPGYSTIGVTFVPGVVNIFNSTILIPSCTDPSVELPDGVYTVTYSVNPNNATSITKNFMRTEIIDCKFMRTFLAIDVQCPCNGHYKGKLKDELRDIKILIDGAIASASECDIVTTELLYSKADSLLCKIKPCECN